ncbi:GNAT family N-acetyltransferase [Algoriphagus hitonicola]|uniref:Phosphinothricin acetyltransferase n=1 Tax=Algoriphagus hitonicola TaxID=435880 RepID=A0A1I2UY34_9BACT|nr:GNAT family N-acetyltransferase [Algoriphagus hitonicola]SFG81099.1 phosphinothricin acetyltransferase [Algoriphagus hitonicola]
MSILIRAAKLEDIPVILEINNYEILQTTVNYDIVPKTLEEQENWIHQKENAGFPILVAEINGRVEGFAFYGTFRPKYGYRFTVEHSVYIGPDSRGKGLGRKLMEQLIGIAKEAGYHSMVGGIDSSNLGSLEFHRKLGFREVGRFKEIGHKFDKWLDLIFVQLLLEESN